ncbi:aminodeoxychorismate/anthranilate synthase component II [SAR202 cluster bacterium AC-409-J13_OGT_754m]|nr:aminodeoxychorismate/anthranilate synthase component II [SAR202 cluster bacterium AC-409-J13_OGT_754m]
MILLIDNYDSFTYNLFQYLSELGAKVHVVRNDAITIDEISSLQPNGIVISPGPCTPNEAGISNDAIEAFGRSIPILGVCLGHQCIAQVYGAIIEVADEIMHGKTSMIEHDGLGLFEGLLNPLKAIRYHSLIVNNTSVPDALEVSAWTGRGQIMGIRHKEFPVEGVQFHPESIMTTAGHELLGNFLKQVDAWPGGQ